MALPAKRDRKDKWSLEEDTLLRKLFGEGKGWNEISEKFPGRSATSCRLHYQNYLRQTGWNEDEKNNLARLYERYVKIVVVDLEV
jgi:hypothetical protein